MRLQPPLIIVAPVKAGHFALLSELLNKIRENLNLGQPLPYEKFETVHYSRILLLDKIENKIIKTGAITNGICCLFQKIRMEALTIVCNFYVKIALVFFIRSFNTAKTTPKLKMWRAKKII